MFTLLYHLQALKWVVPASLMLGTSPTYFLTWGGFRVLTALLPYRVFRAGDDFSYGLYQRLVLFFYENYTGLEVVLYGDVDDLFNKKENVILICNHQSTVDWVIADMLAVRQGTLGYIRYILKDGLRYFPLYGYYFRQHSSIYVKRSGKFQQSHAEAQLSEFNKYKTPFWMVVFPEGTRLNDKTLQRSKKYATENGLAELDYVLTPRHKAVELCVQSLREQTDAIYDVTIAYSGTIDPSTNQRTEAPGLADFLATPPNKLHIRLQRIPMSDVPSGESSVQSWLYGRFQEKNKILERFYTGGPGMAGTLGESGRVHKLGLVSTLPALVTFTALNAALLATSQGRGVYWKAALVGTLFGWFWMSIRAA